MISLYDILYHIIKMYPYFHYILYIYFLCKNFFMKNVAETNKWNEKKMKWNICMATLLIWMDASSYVAR